MFLGIAVIYFGTGDKDTIMFKYKQQLKLYTLGFCTEIRDEYLPNPTVTKIHRNLVSFSNLKKSYILNHYGLVKRSGIAIKTPTAETGYIGVAVKTGAKS